MWHDSRMIVPGNWALIWPYSALLTTCHSVLRTRSAPSLWYMGDAPNSCRIIIWHLDICSNCIFPLPGSLTRPSSLPKCLRASICGLLPLFSRCLSSLTWADLWGWPCCVQPPSHGETIRFSCRFAFFCPFVLCLALEREHRPPHRSNGQWYLRKEDGRASEELGSRLASSLAATLGWEAAG